MAIGQPIFQENDTADQHAIQLRQFVRDVYGNRPGVMASGNLAVSQRAAGANMSVDIAAGGAVITGSAVTNQGLYYAFNDGIVNLAVTAADPSNPRNDLVIVKVRDAFYSGADNDAQLLVIAGTPAGSPVDPDLVALGHTNYLILARIVVGAGVTSILNANITNLAVTTTPYGAIHICTSTTRPAAPPVGLHIYETDTKRVLMWDAVEWLILHEPVQTYTPTWTASVAAPSIGNGSLTGRYQRFRKAMQWGMMLAFGSTTSGGSGFWTFSLPAGVTAVSGLTEQFVSAKAFTAGPFNFTGHGLIQAGGTIVTPYLPLHALTSGLDAARNADGTGAAGTGVPQIGGQYTWQNTHNFGMRGSIFIS